MTYRDHTANFHRFQAALVCEQCHALYETCPHHTRGIRAALRAFLHRSSLPARFARWARKREQHEVARLRTQIAALNAQLSEAEGRIDAETARRKNAEQRLAREKLAHAGYLAASAPGKVRAQG
jgi:C4-dicarboxylate-specific signal transduction histidine kinase